jgi:hypothetical protein
VRQSWLTSWNRLRKECAETGGAWPLPESRRQVADEWIAVARGVPDKPWTQVTLMAEGGPSPEKWIERFAKDEELPSTR